MSLLPSFALDMGVGIPAGRAMAKLGKSLKGRREALAQLMQITMFLTPGLLVFASELRMAFAPGPLIPVILMFAAARRFSLTCPRLPLYTPPGLSEAREML